MSRYSRGMFCPGSAHVLDPFQWKGRREDRAPADTHGPLCQKNAHATHRGNTGQPRNPAFPAQWFDGLCRDLLGDEFLLVTVASQISDAGRPVGLAAPPRELGCSNDSRDHTVWPYASSAVRTTRLARSSRGSAQSTAPPCASHPRRRFLRPPQSQPTTVTTYDRPFPWAGVFRLMP